MVLPLRPLGNSRDALRPFFAAEATAVLAASAGDIVSLDELARDGDLLLRSPRGVGDLFAFAGRFLD